MWGILASTLGAGELQKGFGEYFSTEYCAQGIRILRERIDPANDILEPAGLLVSPLHVHITFIELDDVCKNGLLSDYCCKGSPQDFIILKAFSDTFGTLPSLGIDLRDAVIEQDGSVQEITVWSRAGSWR